MSDLMCPNCYSGNVEYGDEDEPDDWFECLSCGVSGAVCELVEDAEDVEDEED